MHKKIAMIALVGLPVLALASGNHEGGHDTGYGKAGEAPKVSRTIQVTMDDTMRFTPSQISVKAGETVRFFVKNSGQLPHEMVIGPMVALKEHAEMMRKMPGMKHAEPNMVTLKPGQRGGIIWQFSHAGNVDFACLVPGHLEAGMVGQIHVE